jgi:hypothetical protein
MLGKLIKTLGVVRAVIVVLTVASLGVALHEMGAAPEVTGGVTLLTGGALVFGPFGAKYRRW